MSIDDNTNWPVNKARDYIPSAPTTAPPKKSGDAAVEQDILAKKPAPSKKQAKPKGISRRTVLKGAAATGAFVAGGGLIVAKNMFGASSGSSNTASSFNEQSFTSDPVGSKKSDAVDGRVLVVIQLAGGNDGLSMVVPASSGHYYDRRPNTAVSPEEVLALNNEIGLHPNLRRCYDLGNIAVVEGVGSIDGDLSHFGMEKWWERGDVTGKNNYRSGFLSRCIDPLDQGSPLTGLATGGQTPYFSASNASTLAIRNAGSLEYLSADDWELKQAYHEGLRGYGADNTGELESLVGNSWEKLLELGQLTGSATEDSKNQNLQDGGNLGDQLNFAADMIAADVGVRVVHAKLGGFDTHNGQEGRYNQLMNTLDASIAGFMQKAEAKGFADRVLVATVSEFGRRADENGDRGTDHGRASAMLVVGGKQGRLGQAPSLTALRNDSLATTVPFDVYLGSLASWLGVEPGSILPNEPKDIIDLARTV